MNDNAVAIRFGTHHGPFEGQQEEDLKCAPQ